MALLKYIFEFCSLPQNEMMHPLLEREEREYFHGVLIGLFSELH